MIGLSKQIHLWRRKLRQKRRRREMIARTNRNLQEVSATKRSTPLFTTEQAAGLGITAAEVVANLEAARGEGRFPYAPKDGDR